MRTFTQEEFNLLLPQVDIKPRLKKELRFVSSTSALAEDWANYEFIAITDRIGNSGALLLQPDDTLFVAQYEISHRIVDSSTGRSRAIICDFCYTWQSGLNAASITFVHAVTKNSISFLCCGDLACSQHVRTTTKASVVSRARLREDLSNDDRIARLKTRLTVKIEQLGLKAIVVE
jgi:hypothetical protein